MRMYIRFPGMEAYEVENEVEIDPLQVVLNLLEKAIWFDPRDPERGCLSFSELVAFLKSAGASDRAAVKTAVRRITTFAKYGGVRQDAIVSYGIVPALVRHLQAPEAAVDEGVNQHEVERECARLLGILAVKPKHHQLIIDAGALPCLVDLLMRHRISTISRSHIGLLRRVCDVINHLANENTIVKTLARMEGGIPPLVELLEFNVTKVQRAAAMVLRILAFNNDDNKKQIVECNALPTLVLMLRSEDPTIHYTAVGVIENLVNSSPDIMKEVFLAGALQPIICLLSSCCEKSQKIAAHILGQYAATNSDCKVHISQRGAIPPLVGMLKSRRAQLWAVVALESLAQDSHNQAGIALNGGIEPLLKLLDSKMAPVQRDAASVLCGLADNMDIVADIIKAGGFQNLKDGHFKDQPTKECVATTLKRLEENMQGRALKYLIYLMRFAEKEVQIRVAIALAYLCSPHDHKTIFIDNNGLELLLDMLESPSVKQKGDASAALHKLAAKASSFVSRFDVSPLPTLEMYLGEEYVNNAKLSDVTFLVEGGASAAIISGRIFYAHKDCLLSSDAFQAMFDGSYTEREAKHVVIPNIKWDVFELMMRFMYTGTVDVNVDIAQDLFRAADQYHLYGLKRICEHAIARDISVENVRLMYKMSKDFNATALKHACILFMLEKFFKLRSRPWYYRMVLRILPEIRMFFSTLLIKSHPTDS